MLAEVVPLPSMTAMVSISTMLCLEKHFFKIFFH